MAKTAHKLHKTRNHTPSNAKAASIELLNARLADGIDLALATKQAHWNLKGPQFIAVHEMLDTFRTDQDDWNDTMAERIAQLGGTALGTTQTVAAATKLPAYPTDVLCDRRPSCGADRPLRGLRQRGTREYRLDRGSRRRRYRRYLHRSVARHR